MPERADQLGIERRTLFAAGFFRITQQGERQCAEVGEFIQRLGFAMLVRESNFSKAHIAPGTGGVVNNFEVRRFSRKGGDIEVLQGHAIFILAGSRQNRFAIHDYGQAELGIALRLAAADPESDEIPFDDKFAADEFAQRVVLGFDGIAGRGGMGIHHAQSVAADVALVRRDCAFLDRSLAKGGAFHRPAVVSFLVPLFKNNVGARGFGGGSFVLGGANQNCCAARLHKTVVQYTAAVAVI